LNRDPKDQGRGARHATSTTTTNRDVNEAAEARRKLEELFGGNKNSGTSSPTSSSPTPSASAPMSRPQPSGKVFASPRKSLGRSPSEYRLRLERLRISRELPEIEQAANAFLEHHQLPDDADILYKVMQHPNEKVVREALGQISSLLMQGRLNGTLLLEDRLKELANRATEDSTKSYIEGLRSQISATKK
jgi:hypothetical protein